MEIILMFGKQIHTKIKSMFKMATMLERIQQTLKITTGVVNMKLLQILAAKCLKHAKIFDFLIWH